MKQRVFQFQSDVDIPLGSEYLTTAYKEGPNPAHFFLCFVDDNGKPVDVDNGFNGMTKEKDILE